MDALSQARVQRVAGAAVALLDALVREGSRPRFPSDTLDCVGDPAAREALRRASGMDDRVRMLLAPLHHVIFDPPVVPAKEEPDRPSPLAGLSVAQRALLACAGTPGGPVDWFGQLTNVLDAMEAELSFVCCAVYLLPTPPLGLKSARCMGVLAVLRPRSQPQGCALDSETPGLAFVFTYGPADADGSATPALVARRFLAPEEVEALALCPVPTHGGPLLVPSAEERRRAAAVAAAWKPSRAAAEAPLRYVGAAWVDPRAHLDLEALVTGSWFSPPTPAADVTHARQ